MNYQQHYDRLIERARYRTLDGYVEKHHVIPKCLGGTDVNDNIVRLTPEEHYVAHQLLVKLNPLHFGLVGAAMLMSGEASPFTHRNNKTYGWLRRRFSAFMKGRKRTPKHTAKLAAANRGKMRSEEFKAAVGEFHTGRKRSPETGAKISASHKIRCRTPEFRTRTSIIHKGKKRSDAFREYRRLVTLGHIHSAETKAKMSAAAIGKPKSEETRRRMAIAQARTQTEKLIGYSFGAAH